jgi:hypothetical protein
MIDHAHVERWLADYVSAWKSYDADAIGALFGSDAAYRFHPYDEPVRGRDAIVANWLEVRDAPGTYDADYKPIAIDGNSAVAQGRTQYFKADGKTLESEFHNLFVMRFDDEGRCMDFVEWYMQSKGK